jgi:D-alanyl-D-alanine dipeptidase
MCARVCALNIKSKAMDSVCKSHKPARLDPSLACEPQKVNFSSADSTEPQPLVYSRPFDQPTFAPSPASDIGSRLLMDSRQFDKGTVRPAPAASPDYRQFDYGLGNPAPADRLASRLFDDASVLPPEGWRTANRNQSDASRFRYDRAIPIPTRYEGSYRDIPVNLADLRNREPLEKLSKYGVAGEEFYARADGHNAPYNHKVGESLGGLETRQSVAERLAQVNAKLAPLGLEVYVLDAYRPIGTQKALFEHFMEDARKRLGPNGSSEAVLKEALKRVSDPRGFDPKNPHTWPPHSTGGAVDLTLRRLDNGKLVNMGGAFDETSPRSTTAFYERSENQNTPRAIEARNDRRILFNAMSEQGFASNPHEWWHFDYGTQMAIRSLRSIGRKAPNTAFYGAI